MLRSEEGILSHEPAVQMYGSPTAQALSWAKEELMPPAMKINQLNFYSANIPGVARLSGATTRSICKYKVVEAIP